jgi:aryl-alcohol dehydrogenase-like predicted oxidoreductase
MSKIALGTAQFGLPYGISNTHGQVDRTEMDKIWQVARGANITLLDTAIAYGNSEENIGATESVGFDIVTKLPPLSGAETSVTQWVQHQIENSLAKLKRNSLYGLLLHNPADLLADNGDELLAALVNLKRDGLIKKFGVSIYAPTELDSLYSQIPNFVPDIVQTPLNVMDQSIASSGWLTRLSEMNVEVHIRSVFLQGLLLQQPHERSVGFNKWSSVFTQFDSWSNAHQMSPLAACIGHVLSYPEVSRVIIGVTSANELSQIIAASSSDQVRAPQSLQVTDVDLIQPMNWNKQ